MVVGPKFLVLLNNRATFGVLSIHNLNHPPMPLLNVLLVIIVIGLLLWLVNRYIPMQSTIKMILNVVIVIGLIIWLLKVFGVWGQVSSATI